MIRGGMEGDSRVARREVLNVSCSNPVWHKVTFVDDKDDLLMSLLLPDKFKDAFAQGAHRVASVQYMQDNVRGVDDLVQLSVNTP